MAKLFGYKDYVCSNGWIDRFKTRHNITFGKISGEVMSKQKQVPTASDALKAIKTISKFYEHRQSDTKILNHVSEIENIEKFY